MIFSAHDGSLDSFLPLPLTQLAEIKMGNVSIIQRAMELFWGMRPLQPHFQPYLGKMRHDRTGPVTNSVMLTTLENYTRFSHILPCSTASVIWTRNISFH